MVKNDSQTQSSTHVDAGISSDTRKELFRLLRATFETPSDAARWWRSPHPMLTDGVSPLFAAKTARGVVEVRAILAAIHYGGVV